MVIHSNRRSVSVGRCGQMAEYGVIKHAEHDINLIRSGKPSHLHVSTRRDKCDQPLTPALLRSELQSDTDPKLAEEEDRHETVHFAGR